MYSRQIGVEAGWDVVVAGAGPAGCAAALEAGRNGLRVLMLEAGTRPGGMGTSGMVSSFAPMSDGERCIAGGIAEEIMQELYDRGACGPQVTPDFWRRAVQRWIPFMPEELALLYDEKLASAGVVVRCGSRVVDVEMAAESDRGIVDGYVVADVEGLSLVKGRTFVDATGDAVVARACGFPVRRAGKDTERIMPPTLCVLLSGIDWNGMELDVHGTGPRRQKELLESALSKGRFSKNDRHLPGLFRIGRETGMMNAGHLFNTDALDRESLSAAYPEGRRLIREYIEFYREYFDGCRNMELVATAPALGIRESGRILGEYELSHADFRSRRDFTDGIGRCAGSVDIHVYDDSPAEYDRYRKEFQETDRLGTGESFTIPYRSLIPKDSINMWVAGRCVSADVKVQGALRIQPAATVMGQAVGLAATLALQSDISAMGVDIEELRAGLKSRGAVL